MVLNFQNVLSRLSRYCLAQFLHESIRNYFKHFQKEISTWLKLHLSDYTIQNFLKYLFNFITIYAYYKKFLTS